MSLFRVSNFSPLFISILFFTTAASSAPNKILYTSLTNPQKTVELTNNKYKSALLVDESCHNCTKLIDRLARKCASFDISNFVIFATGSIKNLKKKLRPLLEKNIHVYRNPNIQTLLATGASSVPSYFSKNGRLYDGVTDSYKALIRDKVCVK